MSFPWPRSFEVTEVERIERTGDRRVLAYPGACAVDNQQEFAAAPILLIEPQAHAPWIGIFYGGRTGLATPELMGWPDGRSFCVVNRGLGVVVASDEPTTDWIVEVLDPVTSVRPVAEAGLVLFTDFIRIACFDGAGLRWRSQRLAWDDVRIEGVDVDHRTIHAVGFDAPSDNLACRFTVDLDTGTSTDRPYP